MMLGEHDLQDKRWMYEESQRMPFIVRDPRCPYKGAKSDLMINNIDFAPTLIEMVGGKNLHTWMERALPLCSKAKARKLEGCCLLQILDAHDSSRRSGTHRYPHGKL